MFILNLLFAVFVLLNIAGVYAIGITCAINREYGNSYLFFYPYLIEELREKLNIAGTVIVIVLFSIILAPAIILYFLTLGVVTLGYLEAKLFCKLFARKDKLDN